MSINSFDDLFKKSTNFEELTKTLKGKKKDYNDDRFWKATKDKAGNAQAIIRFLPTSKGDELPWVETHTHAFKGPSGQWFIEACPSTIGKPCPVCEANQALWNSGSEEDKNVARSRKRVQKYISNILVVKDPANPANEGKVFLFKFGPQIMGKITDATSPQFEGDAKINPFHFTEGANFKLRISKKDKFDNYEKSVFEEQSTILDGDMDKIKALWESQFSLKEFTDPTQYQSYDQLKAKLDRVLGGSTQGSKSVEDDLLADDIPTFAESNTRATSNSIPGNTLEAEDLGSLDDLDAFQELLN